MTAPILPLDASNLTSWTNLGIVGAWMLFPDDERWRDRYIRAGAVQEHLERSSGATVSREYFDAVVLLALSAASPDEIASEREKRCPRGHGAGLIIYNAMKQIRLGRPGTAPVQTATKAVGQAIWGHSDTSKHVNKAVAETYRPVAALWAAFVHLDDGGDDDVIFPCNPADLPDFLARAEGFRKLAEETKPPRRREPILPPGVSVQLPDDVLALLPRGTLTTVLP